MTPEGPVFGAPRGQDLHLAQRYTRWAFWGCLVVVLAGVLLLGGLALIMMRDPRFWRAAENLAKCQVHLQNVSGALDRYVQDKGHLPARLNDLYPTYLVDKTNLRCPADTSPGTQSSYVLRPGVPWGKGNAVLVYCPHHPATAMIPGKSAKEAGNVIPVIYQDGRVDKAIAPLARFLAPAPRSSIKR